MALKIDAVDVIKVVLQFLKENSLNQAYEVLQEEAQVSLNAVDSVDTFKYDIENGHWSNVLKTVSTLRVPTAKLATLYEHIVLELAEVRETDTAHALLRSADPLIGWLRQQDPGRYLRLDRIVTASKQAFDPFEAYGGLTKESIRANLAKDLSSEVAVVPPSRLLALVGQALKWQQHQGLIKPGVQYDLFKDTQKVAREEAAERQETMKLPPRRVDAQIAFGSKSHANVVMFPPDGQCIVTGSTDGFVEVWDYITGLLRTDLDFQKRDDFMMHDEAVLALAFSSDSDMLASGSQDGKIKVWQLYTGKCLRKFEAAHTKGVTCISFSRDNSQILSGSFDQTMRVHGLRSGKALKTFRGHTSFVNACLYSNDGNKILSASSDGTIKVWDTKTTECLQTFRPTESVGSGGFDASITHLFFVPKQTEQFVVCNKSSTAYLMNMKGQVLKKYSAVLPLISSDGGSKEKPKSHMMFISCTVSPYSDFLYCLGDDCNLYCFDFTSGDLVTTLKVHEKEPLGLAHHPYLNLLATYSDGPVRLWKP